MSYTARMSTYVALLRGINVGGNKKVPMADLKKMMEKMGFTDVKTILNTGNVLFEASEKEPAALAKKIETQLEKSFGFSVGVLLRTSAQIQKLIDSDPFAKIRVTPQTRLYVTFLPENTKSSLKIPYVSPDKGFRILAKTSGELTGVLVLSETAGTVDAMRILDKEFGKAVTTRNWNTVLKFV